MNENIPVGWQRLPFKQICKSLVNGGTPDTGSEAFWNGKIPWITGADFNAAGIGEFRRYISDAAIQQTATNVVRSGNLLLVTRTGVGKIAIAPCDIAISQDITGVYLDETQAEANYIYYLMQRGVEELKKLNQGTSINGIIRSDLEKYEIIIPLLLSEQKRIAALLGTIDNTIQNAEALIAKYQQIKAGLIHDLFTRGVTNDGKLRPPREETPELYKKSPIGWIPKEWDALRLGSILRDAGGYLQTGPFGSQLHAHEYRESGIPVVMPQDIENGCISTAAIARIDETRANTLARHRLRQGDIIIARRGELSRAASITFNEEGWICGTGCFLLRLGGSRLLPEFVANVYRHDIIQRQIAGRAVGTTMSSLNNDVMGALFFPYIEPEEQQRITGRLAACDNHITALESDKSKLLMKKQGLMYDLLTGRMRVS